MTDKQLSTEPYKGVRDFYPEDAAVQQYIFTTWAKTAESFGFERYNASILEPAELYKAKGAENEELINEQTYSFTDRGDREVTLRPEMTPTVARMVATKARELAMPLRWYSIPNLFRYERPQRGRLREHWQFNCDIFGSNDIAADIEMIALAHQTLIYFGATPDMFEIRVNDRAWLNEYVAELGLEGKNATNFINLLDRKDKVDDFDEQAVGLIGNALELPTQTPEGSSVHKVVDALKTLNINNVKFSPTTVRGFSYYTGTIFEIFDTSSENNRALLGGGRYDNLTSMFGGEVVSGVGFGMGDVTMVDFLETHNLLPSNIKRSNPKVIVVPMKSEQNLFAEKVALHIRQAGHPVLTDISNRKVGEKISKASERGSQFIIVIGEDEVNTGNLTIKNLESGEEKTDRIDEIIQVIS